MIFDPSNQLVEEFEQKEDEDSVNSMTLPIKKILFSGFISEYFFPRKVLNYLMSNLDKQVTDETIALLDRCYTEWEQRFFVEDVHLVVTRVAAIHFIRTGQIQIDNQFIKIPNSYKFYMLRKFWELLLINEKMHVYFMDNEDQGDSASQMNVSILFTETNATYIKGLENAGSRKYVISHPDIVEDLYKEIDAFIQVFKQQKVTTKDLEKMNEFINLLEKNPTKRLSSRQIASYLGF